MISISTIKSLIDDRIEGTSCFVVDIKVDTGNNILVELDNDKGISIDDCISVSRAIEHNLDRESEDFSLQVTSPGADKPLKVWRQYVKNVGRSVEVTLLDGKVETGKMVAVTDDGITLEIKPAKPKLPITKVEISKDQIKQTKIILSFK
jgi:ribosome maturation factor RimP